MGLPDDIPSSDTQFDPVKEIAMITKIFRANSKMYYRNPTARSRGKQVIQTSAKGLDVKYNAGLTQGVLSNRSSTAHNTARRNKLNADAGVNHSLDTCNVHPST